MISLRLAISTARTPVRLAYAQSPPPVLTAHTGRNHLIIFGGMAIKPQSDNPEDLCVLNDVRLFDLTTRHWLPAVPIPTDSAIVPNARYAHLSSVTADRLFIIGGQDLANVWLDDVYVFDLVQQTWICRRDYPRHCGTYRSVAVTADQRVRLPQDELRGGQSSARLGQPGTRFNIDKKAAPAPNATQSDALIHLPYSAAPTDDYPCDIFLFSNYNVRSDRYLFLRTSSHISYPLHCSSPMCSVNWKYSHLSLRATSPSQTALDP